MSDAENRFGGQDTSGGLNGRLIVGVVAAAALALFLFQNTEDAEVDFLWMSGSIPLFLLLLITVGLTLILAMVGMWWLRRRS